MLAFVHYKNTPNIGDVMCAPYHYFDFKEGQSFDLSDEIPPCEAVIYGGGAIEPKLRTERLHHNVDAKTKIAWGVGTSRRGRQDFGPLVDDLDLCGVREFGREIGQKRTYYVPCASCMSPEFDRVQGPVHDVVFYTHGVYELFDSEGLPRMNNRASNLRKAIEFLASGDTVVTNSFHGTYWALLLGKKVVCIPFSSKFYGFKAPPSYCTDGDWKSAVSAAQKHTDYLPESRSINQDFSIKVRSLISSRRR